jgi:N-methylhydantoinase A
VRRGRDPREFALVACGGGGPVHAAFVARELRIPEILVPRAPGHFSALGMLMSDMRHDLVRTAILATDDPAAERTAAAIWDELTQRMLATFAEEGVDGDRIRLERTADLRYRGQEHTVAVPVPGGDYDEAARTEVRRRFDEAHERLYTFRLEGPAEFVNFRLTGWGAVRKPPLREIPAGRDVAAAHVGTRVLDLAVDRRAQADVYRRELLLAGAEIEGPAVIEEPATSTLVLPGMRCVVDRLGNLVVETGA